MKDLQQFVFSCLLARGYGRLSDETAHEYHIRQYLKAAEEMGEVARFLFDGKQPSIDEIADVIIPLLALAEDCGYDMGAAIMDKARTDIQRGVR